MKTNKARSFLIISVISVFLPVLFFCDTKSPISSDQLFEIISTNPSDGSINIPTNSNIIVVFTNQIDSNSFTPESFILDHSVEGTLSYTDKVVIFTPLTYLQFNTEYNGTLSKNSRDVFGNNLSDNYSWSFTTGQPWMSKAVMPTPRRQVATAVLNGLIYTIAGLNNKDITDSVVECFNPASNTWFSKAPLRCRRYSYGAIEMEEKIYAIGGNTGDTAGISRYDSQRDQWVLQTKLQSRRQEFSMAVVDNKIYIIGGNIWGVGVTGLTERYDPLTNQWEVLAPMPTARYCLATAVVNGFIYALGGTPYSYSDALDIVECYNPATNSWSTETPMLSKKYKLTSIAHENKIYVFGGTGPDLSYYGIPECYDPVTKDWEYKTSAPLERTNTASAIVDGKIYILGGYGKECLEYNCEAVNEYDPRQDP